VSEIVQMCEHLAFYTERKSRANVCFLPIYLITDMFDKQLWKYSSSNQ